MQTFQDTDAQDRCPQEWDKLKQIDGKTGGKITESLKDTAFDRGYSAIGFTFDGIYSHPILALRSREIATIAVLTALGNAQPQLKVHIHRALDVGCTRTEIVKAILRVAVCVGFAAVSQSTTVVKEVFQERDV